mmetsp:Transcript_3156/g.9215  ORF Transcript_3156/g.9215 Transcript_3156/m.9215 type:complete len:227 (-) Transcript_3156:182-862(-)
MRSTSRRIRRPFRGPTLACILAPAGMRPRRRRSWQPPTPLISIPPGTTPMRCRATWWQALQPPTPPRPRLRWRTGRRKPARTARSLLLPRRPRPRTPVPPPPPLGKRPRPWRPQRPTPPPQPQLRRWRRRRRHTQPLLVIRRWLGTRPTGALPMGTLPTRRWPASTRRWRAPCRLCTRRRAWRRRARCRACRPEWRHRSALRCLAPFRRYPAFRRRRLPGPRRLPA